MQHIIPLENQNPVLEHSLYLLREGYSESTIERCIKLLKQLSQTTDLDDPNSVKTAIANLHWSDNTRQIAIYTYARYAKSRNIQFDKPRCIVTSKIPFIPLESEIDSLISATGKKTSIVLQLMKETAMRIGECWRLKWSDVDNLNYTVTINTPEKNSNPRQLKISPKLCYMLNNLPKNSNLIFGYIKLVHFSSNFAIQRRKIALKLQNPRLNQIHFHTLRHWKASTEYQKTRDIIHVQRMLGHKSIMNTMKYVHLVTFQSDEYHCKTAKSLEEATSLIEAGFEYVTELDGCKLFRKRK